MSASLFTPLAAEGLTSLKIQYDWRTGEHELRASRDWGPSLDFSRYIEEFTAHSILTGDARVLGTEEVWALFAAHGLDDYLREVLDLIRQGRHVGIEAYHHAGKDIRFLCHQHSRTLGLFNRYQATMAGGIRRHFPEEPELDVIVDGLNLGRAMSYKNVAADLAFGGCKTCVQMDELDVADLEALGFLAYAIDRCRTMTGPDMFFPTEMADVVNEHFSAQFTNGPSSPLGESGRPTAYGTFLSLQEAIRFREGPEASVAGKTATVMGLGAVGWYLAEHLLEAGARVLLADMDERRIERFLAEHEGDAAAIPSEEVLAREADILCPAAIGGIIDEDVIPTLRLAYIWGPANNQLRASSQAEEERLARLLAERGILFQTEWWHNTAGVMCGAEEYMSGADASYDSLVERIEATIPAKTRSNLEEAARRGITPTENAYRTAGAVLFGADA